MSNKDTHDIMVLEMAPAMCRVCRRSGEQLVAFRCTQVTDLSSEHSAPKPTSPTPTPQKQSDPAMPNDSIDGLLPIGERAKAAKADAMDVILSRAGNTDLREQIRCITGECFHTDKDACLYNDNENLPSYYKTDAIMQLIESDKAAAVQAARVDELKKWRTMIERLSAYVDSPDSLAEYDERILGLQAKVGSDERL